MRLSIVIVNWNTTELLKRCLGSIFKYPPQGEFEVFVVDNASSDFDGASVSLQFPRVCLIVNERNEGYAKGNNQALPLCSGEFVLLLNPDTEIREGTVDALLDFMKAHPDAAAVGCKLVRPDGRLDRSCRGFPYPLAVAMEYLGLSRAFPKSRLFGSYRMTWFDYDSVIEVDQPMASCLMILKRVFDEIGLFDLDFPLFFNDVDWCYRAKQKGWKVYFTPRTEVLHHGSASTKQIRRQAVVESHKSLARFYRKHYKGKTNPLVYALAMIGIWINVNVIHKPGREL